MKYNDKVRVTSWFYEWSTWIIKYNNPNNDDRVDRWEIEAENYWVMLDWMAEYETMCKIIKTEYLELIK